MTFGLACDRDGYDLRIPKCSNCGSRGCPNRDRCPPILPRGLPPMQEQPMRVPNRLLGVEINEHGEAI